MYCICVIEVGELSLKRVVCSQSRTRVCVSAYVCAAVVRSTFWERKAEGMKRSGV